MNHPKLFELKIMTPKFFSKILAQLGDILEIMTLRIHFL